MKKIILLTVLSLGALSTYAQTSFGVVAGVRNATQRISNESPTVNSKFFLQWHAGVMADIPLAGNFYLQPQLLASTKGDYRESRNLDSAVYSFMSDASSKVRMTYLELPVNVLYKRTLGAGKLIAGAGPYIAYGLGGRSRSTTTSRRSGQTSTFEQTIKFSNETHLNIESLNKHDYYRPLDAGLNFIAGYELNNGLCFNVSYSLGLTNVSPSDGTFSDGHSYKYPTRKNSYFALSLGYLLIRHNRS